MKAVNFQNVLVLLGIIFTTGAILYFAAEFGDVISDWGRILDFLLLGVVFAALGVHFERAGDATGLIDAGGWRWLKVTNALYILAAISAIATVGAFFAVDDIDRVAKLLVLFLLGLGLILFAARRYGQAER